MACGLNQNCSILRQYHDLAAKLLVVAQGKLQDSGGATPAQLESLDTWQESIDQLDLKLAEQKQLQDLKAKMATDPEGVLAELASFKADGFTSSLQHWLYAQALRKTGNPSALTELNEIVLSKQSHAKAASKAMIQLMSRKNADLQGFDLEQIKARDHEMFHKG